MMNEYLVDVLHDPIDEPDLPRLIVWSKMPDDWRRLWTCREGLERAVIEWFRRLDESGRQPVVGQSIVVGTIIGAEQTARFIVEQIAEWAGTTPMLPDWYLGSKWWDRCGGRKPICRVLGGVVDRWASVSEASRATGHCREDIGRWARSGAVSKSGWAWYFDFAG